LIGEVNISGIDEAFMVTKKFLVDWGDQYLQAIDQAAKLFRYIRSQKGIDNVVYEISIDEVDKPQTPARESVGKSADKTSTPRRTLVFHAWLPKATPRSQKVRFARGPC
jgi:hypothetical protein